MDLLRQDDVLAVLEHVGVATPGVDVRVFREVEGTPLVLATRLHGLGRLVALDPEGLLDVLALRPAGVGLDEKSHAESSPKFGRAYAIAALQELPPGIVGRQEYTPRDRSRRAPRA
jgi:hypothetical protein